MNLKRILILIFLATCNLFNTQANSAGNKEEGLIVLCYHKIMDNPDSAYNITEKTFDKQMNYLKENGYNTISINDMDNWLYHKGKLPSKPVLITFDDGNISQDKKAFPVLQRYGFTGTFFIIAGKIGIPLKGIKEMLKSGFTIGSHTLNHYSLTDLDSDSLRNELIDSKKILEDMLHIKIKYLAYTPMDSLTNRLKLLLKSLDLKAVLLLYQAISTRISTRLS